MPYIDDKEWPRWRQRLHEIIFESDTPEGKAFDIGLLIAILVSLTVVVLEGVRSIRLEYGDVLSALEWFFTAIFTLEFILRAVSMRRAKLTSSAFSAWSTCFPFFRRTSVCFFLALNPS